MRFFASHNPGQDTRKCIHRSHALDTNTMESIRMRPRSGCTNGGSSLSEDGRSFGSFSKNISNQQTPWVFHLQKKCSDLVRPFSGNMHLKVAVSLSIKEHPSTGLETLGLELNEGSQAQKTLYRTCEINILLIRT